MKQHNPDFVTLCEQARANIEEISTDQLAERIQSNHPMLLIDVREESEWAQGHIPQAIHLGKGIIERDIAKHVSDKNDLIVLYCGGGYRSALAAINLQSMGYTQVESVAGGFRSWKQEARPTT